MPIKAIIIDDERLARNELKKLLLQHPDINIIDEASSVDEGIEKIDIAHPDLIFLDIQMPDITGIEFYKSLTNKPLVVFTTAYKDFAVEGFNTDAVDYLLKPFEYDRFLKAAYKLKEYTEFLSAQEVQLNSIFIKVNYEIMKINLKEVDLIEALDDYIKIYTKPTPVLTLMTLKGILEKLPSRDFIRVHRSYIVPIAKINKFSKSKIWIGEKEIPIGSSYGSVYDQLLLHSQSK